MDPMKTRFSITTLGCKTNQFESAAMIEQLVDAGYQQIDFEQGADLVLVNTCTVTAATDSQSRNLIRRAKRLNPAARVIVTGCYAQVDSQALIDLPEVSLVIGNQEKAHLIELLCAENDDTKVHVGDIRRHKSIEPLNIHTFAQRSRAFVQIQNGCDAFCAYCIIPYARGRSRSVVVADVVAQVEELSRSGYPELVLTGIHIGRYGQDLSPQSDLLALLRAIEHSSFSGRLRLGSLEPNELSSELLAYIAAAEWICPHFHIPLQAGDDAVLARMNRHYTCADFSALLDKIHKSIPGVAIGLDIIAGFPAETEAEFNNTLAFVESLDISHLHVFPFSKRQGTPAATMPGQINGHLIKDRAAQLRKIGEAKNRVYRNSFIGKTLEIVIESGVKDELQKGVAENYLPVWVQAHNLPQGQLVRVKAVALHQDGLKAELL
jgi:threonylcarbamoyladenosine tRNA methylthiotransferase MtaB